MTGVVREKAGLRVKRERRLTLLNKHVLLDRSHYYTKKYTYTSMCYLANIGYYTICIHFCRSIQ